ncbi:hypothetical protein WMY93_023567 [Mugilogobius chulae]|uniref:E3 ubiquitin-protein ligase SHPRH n=1 Tax=Mugilogobius chulae TaxID=88201 RepID=A0AAW0NBM3_9GOBI
MLEDRKNEVILEKDLAQTPSCSNLLELIQNSEHKDETATCNTVKTTEDLPSTSTDTLSAPASSVTIKPLTQLGPIWKALIGEFTVQPKWLPSDFEHRTFTLQRTNHQCSLIFIRNNDCEEDSGALSEMEENMLHKTECSLGRISLGDLDWLLQRRVIHLCHQAKEDSYKVGIYLLEAGLGKPEFLSESTTRLKKANQILQKMMEYFYDFIVPEVVDNEEEECDTELERQNIEELYDYAVPVSGRQLDVKRERFRNSSPKEQGLHHLWHEVVTLCGKKLFYNPYTGCLIREFPLAGVEWPGGILADEMGLGKTVEVLALILCNPRQNLQQEGQSVNYFVPPPPEKKKAPPRKSEVSQPKLKSTSHVKGLPASMSSYMRSCYGYDPVKNRNHIKRTMKKLLDDKKSSRSKCICGELGIIDYKPRVQCMNCDLWQHADCVNYKEESLETTPFFCPHCLVAMTPVPTGATLIISPSSICHQWVEEINKHIRSPRSESCGTPVQRGLEDLYGLVLFLRLDPFWVKRWWDQLLYRPYRRGNTAPLYSVISQVLWRSAKKDVIDQIQIPAQTEEVHWLRFSPVEGHFYHRQHEVCSQDALLRLRKITDWSLKLGALDRRTVHTILGPLLRLRQACCHPQAVRGEFLPLQKSTMTMEELLKSLQKKCRSECEEAHRQLVCALNGLAGIHIIRGEFADGAEMYREVLRSSEEHKGKLKTDSLQRLHATHNLMELLNAKHPGIPPTLRDDKLSEEAEQLRQHYMTKYDSEVADAFNALQPVLQNIKELKRKVKLNSPWWLDIIQKAVCSSSEEELVIRVKNELTSNYKQPTNKLSMADKFRDASGLQFILTTKLQELLKSQKTVQDAVKRLEGPASQEVIDEATVCHLRPNRLPLNNCVFCKADELFNDYESKLFSHTVKGQTAIFEEMIEEEEGLVDDRLPTTSRGLWAASETERALKSILAFARFRRLDPELVEEGSTFMELFENWKKEYKLLHEYWGVLRNHVSAIDELGMATERLRVRLPDEPKPKLLHIIEPHEVEQNRVKLLNDQAMAKSQLQKKLGQQLYLNNLEKSQDKSTGGLNPEPCPICARPLGQEWAVLTCGHCFCNECIAIMVEQYSVGARNRAIKCAICRQPTCHSEISYVFTAQSNNHDQEIPVKGSHSTKVEAVIRTLKKVQISDAGAKCLVFSTWQSVLDIIAKALFDNNMEFTQINGTHKFQENLSSFKHDSQINILLLPLHTGSNGLNIIEATHVLLVEPILNPAIELQAIGRVHRIGQTKPTFVHRFLIKSTIEERMQTMMKTAEKSHSNTSMKHSEASVLTVADLAELFTDDSGHLE